MMFISFRQNRERRNMKNRSTILKRILSGVLATATAVSMTLTGYVPKTQVTAKAASGFTSGQVGHDYTFSVNASGSYGRIKARLMSVDGSGNGTFQSYGMTWGAWPGGLGSSSDYGGCSNVASYTGVTNLVGYDRTGIISNFYNTYKDYMIGTPYLIQTSSPDSSYRAVLQSAAASYSSLGARYNNAWLGVEDDSSNAWCVNSNGYVYGSYRGNSFVVAPAFTLSASATVLLSGDTFGTKPQITRLSCSKSSEIVYAGNTRSVSDLIGTVSNDNGVTSAYTVSSAKGYLSGSSYTVPSNLSTDTTDTLTVTSTEVSSVKTTVTVNCYVDTPTTKYTSLTASYTGGTIYSGHAPTTGQFTAVAHYTTTYRSGKAATTSQKDVTLTSVSAPDTSAGTHAVTVSYTENGITQTASVNVTWTENTVKSKQYKKITVTYTGDNPRWKGTVPANSDFDVIASRTDTYMDGSTKDVNDEKITSFTKALKETSGTNYIYTITVNTNGQTLTEDVTVPWKDDSVAKSVLQSITATYDGTTVYTGHDPLNSHFTVTGSYSDTYSHGGTGSHTAVIGSDGFTTSGNNSTAGNATYTVKTKAINGDTITAEEKTTTCVVPITQNAIDKAIPAELDHITARYTGPAVYEKHNPLNSNFDVTGYYADFWLGGERTVRTTGQTETSYIISGSNELKDDKDTINEWTVTVGTGSAARSATAQVNFTTDKKVRELESQIAELNQQVSDLTSANEKLTNDLNAKTKEAENLRAQIADLQKQLDDADKTIKDQENTIEGLNNDKDTLTEENAAVTKERDNLQKQVDTLQGRLDKIEKEIGTTNTDKLKQMKSDADNYAGILEKYSNVVSKMVNGEPLTLDDMKTLAGGDKITALENELDANKKTITENQEKIQSLESDLDSAQNKAKQLESDLTDAKNTLKSLQDDVNTTKGQLKNAQDAVTEAQKKLDEQKDTIGTLNTQLKEAEDNVTEAQTKQQEISKELNDQKESYEKAIDKLNDEKLDTETKLQEAQKALEKAQEDYNTLKNSSDAQKEDLDNALEKIKEAQKTSEKLEAENEELKSQNGQQAKALELAQGSLTDANKDIEELNTKLGSMTDTNKKQQKDLESLSADIAALKVIVADYDATLAKYAKYLNIDTTGKTRDQIKKEIEDILKDYKSLKDKLDNASHEIDKYKKIIQMTPIVDKNTLTTPSDGEFVNNNILVLNPENGTKNIVDEISDSDDIVYQVVVREGDSSIITDAIKSYVSRNRYTIDDAHYIDIKVYKNGDFIGYASVFNENIYFVLKIPSVLTLDNVEYTVLREHNGVVEKLNTSTDIVNGDITVGSNKFSSFVVAHRTVGAGSNNGNGGSNSGNGNNSSGNNGTTDLYYGDNTSTTGNNDSNSSGNGSSSPLGGATIISDENGADNNGTSDTNGNGNSNSSGNSGSTDNNGSSNGSESETKQISGSTGSLSDDDLSKITIDSDVADGTYTYGDDGCWYDKNGNIISGIHNNGAEPKEGDTITVGDGDSDSSGSSDSDDGSGNGSDDGSDSSDGYSDDNDSSDGNSGSGSKIYTDGGSDDGTASEDASDSSDTSGNSTEYAKKSPKTSDDTPVIPYVLVVALFSAAAITGLKKRKDSRN